MVLTMFRKKNRTKMVKGKTQKKWRQQMMRLLLSWGLNYKCRQNSLEPLMHSSLHLFIHLYILYCIVSSFVLSKISLFFPSIFLLIHSWTVAFSNIHIYTYIYNMSILLGWTESPQRPCLGPSLSKRWTFFVSNIIFLHLWFEKKKEIGLFSTEQDLANQVSCN
jgi:membrane-associated HD superfamily phosphohydrolase